VAYTGVYVLGDSLVDSGNALKLANFYGGLPFTDLPEGAPTADKGYFLGRFSDGYVFTDLLSNKAIGLVSKPVFPFGYEDPVFGLPLDPFAGDPSGKNLNFAYGGAHIIQRDEVVPELDAQTDALRDAYDGDADPNALFLVTFGGNDVRDLAPTASDPVPWPEAYAKMQDIADELLHELGQLIDDGAQNIVITGLADVGLIPKYDRDGNGMLDATEQMRSDAATEYSIYLDTLIRTQVVPALQQQLADQGIDPNKIVYVPLMDYSDGSGTVVGALNANLPTLAALHNVNPPPEFDGTPAEYLASQLQAHSLEYRDLVFFDGVHPNAQAHALLASYMESLITGAEWIETMPLLGADVDYRAVTTIGAAGEVDRTSIAMVAGTTYTFQMLGVSTVTPYVLGELDIASLAGVVLADPSLRLLSSAGTILQSDDDSGIGLDASLSFNAATAGTYTLEASAIGSLTGSYVLTATVSGAAMAVGNSYTVNSPLTLVLEGAGGAGVDVVKASVSYALSAGSEIEFLSTTSDRGKGAINLTGNEFDQTIVGNNGANVIEGKAGVDVMTGGGGNDIFVLSSAALSATGNVDRITDYGKGDIVDVSQILSVAAGTNVVSGGFLRVTTSGLIQVDANGGGDHGETLSTVNGNGTVAVRYLSGGAATKVSVARVNDPSATAVLTGAVAAAGLAGAPMAAQPHDALAGDTSGPLHGVSLGTASLTAQTAAEGWYSHFALPNDRMEPVEGVNASAASSAAFMHSESGDAVRLVDAIVAQEPIPALPGGTDGPAHLDAAFIAAPGIAMPALDAVADAATPKLTGEVARVLADTLAGGGHGPSIDALLDSLPTAAHAPELFAALANVVEHSGFAPAYHAFAMEAFVAHLDAPAPA
jgi:lysophospholipase L1-like esterase